MRRFTRFVLAVCVALVVALLAGGAWLYHSRSRALAAVLALFPKDEQSEWVCSASALILTTEDRFCWVFRLKRPPSKPFLYAPNATVVLRPTEQESGRFFVPLATNVPYYTVIGLDPLPLLGSLPP